MSSTLPDSIGASSGACSIKIATSKLPTGFLAPASIPGIPTFLNDDPVNMPTPAFAVAGSDVISVMRIAPADWREFRTVRDRDGDAVPGTGISFEDYRLLASGERVETIAVLPRDPSIMKPVYFAEGLAVHNQTIAYSGIATQAVIDAAFDTATAAGKQGSKNEAGAGVVRLCENAFDPLQPLKDAGANMDRTPMSDSAAINVGIAAGMVNSTRAWTTLVCANLLPPADPVQIAPIGSGGFGGVIQVQLEQSTFGFNVALDTSVLAVSSPALSTTAGNDGGIVAADAVLVYTPSSLTPSSSSTYGQVQTSDFSTAISTGTAAVTALVDPSVISSVLMGDARVINSGFGRSIDVGPASTAGTSLLAIGAPSSSDGRGRVYVYSVSSSSKPQLQCFLSGGLPGWSSLGSSVQVLPASAYDLPAGAADADRTLGLVAVSIRGAHLANMNDTSTGVASTQLHAIPASIVLAIRSHESMSSPSMLGIVEAQLGETDLTSILGVPHCSVVSIIGANVSLSLKAQLGLDHEANAAVATALQQPKTAAALLSSKAQVAVAGSSLLIADSAAPTWNSNVLVPVTIANSTSGATSVSLTPGSKGTGRLWHTAFCPRDAVKTKSESHIAVVPYTCVACPDGMKSFGGTSATCSSCSGRHLSGDGSYTSDNAVAQPVCAGAMDRSGIAKDTLVEIEETGLSLINGQVYRAYVRGITASGRWFEREGPMFMVDSTPPEAGRVYDGRGRTAPDGSAGTPENCPTCNNNVDYTNDGTAVHITGSGFTEDASGIARYVVGASTVPCDGLLHRTCPIVDPKKPVYSALPCSQLEQDWRSAKAVQYGVSGDRIGVSPTRGGFQIPFDLSNPASFDVAPLTDVGLNATHSFFNLNLPHGTRYFACVIARAGLYAAASSDGVVIDHMPPAVSEVKDGLDFDGGSDWESSTILDGLAAHWTAEDYESGILYNSLAFTSDITSVSNALTLAGWDDNSQTFYSSGTAVVPSSTAVNWDDVQSTVANTLSSVLVSPFEMTPISNVFFAAGLRLAKGSKYYAVVRTSNKASILSHVAASNGAVVGSAAIKPPPPGKTANVGFDTGSAADASLSPEERRAKTGGTVGSMAIPAESLLPPVSDDGTVSDQPAAASMVAGALSDDEMAAQGMPNPGKNESSKPAANFVFGNYTFQIKAKDENGTVIDGFKFAKPIMITMYFNPAELGSRLAGDNTGRDAAASFTPQLNLFDIETGTWINARDSCPVAQRFESVDYVALKYTVAICHLTQFGLFYQRRPVALAYPLDAPALLVGSDLMPQPMTAADQASIRSSPTAAPQSSLWILGSSTSGGFILDGTSSYDPDGEIASAVWSITAGPQVDALDAELVDGTLTRAAYTAARADLNAQLTFLNSVGTRAFVSDSILSSGVYTFGLVVTDGQGSTDAMNTSVVVHSPPVAVMSRSFYPSQALVNAGVAAVIPVSGSEISDADTWALAEALDDDVIVDATASTFDSTTGSSGVTYQWTIAAASGSGNASLPDIINATSPVALIRNVSGGAYAVSVIITDVLNTTGSAYVLVGLPLLYR